MLSVQTLTRRIRQRVHDLDEITYDDEEILDCINCGVRFIRRVIADINPASLLSEHKGVLPKGVKTITLETRPTKIINVTTGTPEKALQETELSFAVHEWDDAEGTPKEFYRTGSQTINFYPAPDAPTNYTIRTVDDIEELTEEDNSPLNTEDGIAENQLSFAVNVEVDHATGRLKTVAGTTDVWHFPKIFAAAYDEINDKLLLIDEDKKVYAADFETKIISDELGTLSGDLYPITTSWEDGLLIASGGKVQYFNGENFMTIEESPNATGVYIRAGRVLVTDENNVRYSGVGDETNWTEDTGDDSSSKFVEAGYKDGGKLIGMTNLSSDVLLIKDNRRLYRLSGEYPDWSISEVSRNVEVSGRLSFCSVADSIFILGRNEIQSIQTTSSYGDDLNAFAEKTKYCIEAAFECLQELHENSSGECHETFFVHGRVHEN